MDRINETMPGHWAVPWEWEDRVCTCVDPRYHVVDDVLGFVCSKCLKTFRYNLYLCRDCGQSYLNIGFTSRFKCNNHLRCYACLTAYTAKQWLEYAAVPECPHPHCRMMYGDKKEWHREGYIYPKPRRNKEEVQGDLDDFLSVDSDFSVDSADFD